MNEVGRNVRTLQNSSILRTRVYSVCVRESIRDRYMALEIREEPYVVEIGRKERNGEYETAWKHRQKFEVIPASKKFRMSTNNLHC